MKCPKCSGKTRVDSTMHMLDNTVYRRRQCTECQFIFGTIEHIVNDQEQFHKDWYIQKKRQLIKKERRND